jgi:adenosine/AMP kinase
VAKAFCSFFIAAGHALFLSVRNRYTHDIKNSVKMHPAIKLGHSPLVARVRNTNKGNPDHWRAA